MLLLNKHIEKIQEKEVLKLAFTCSLNNWDKAETILTEKFQLLLRVLQAH
jgi:hypothetical protein